MPDTAMGSALDLTSKENRGLGKGNYSLTQFLEMEESDGIYTRKEMVYRRTWKFKR